MVLTLGPLVRAFFPFVLTNMLDVLVAWSLECFSNKVKSKCDVVTFVMFMPIEVKSKGCQLIEIFWRSNS